MDVLLLHRLFGVVGCLGRSVRRTPKIPTAGRCWAGTNLLFKEFGRGFLRELILELSNWMIGCDVSDYLSSRATNWLYLGRNGMHGEVALCDGPTAMMVFMNRRYGEVTEDEDAEAEGCPRYWALQQVNPFIAQGSRPVGCP